MFICDFNLEQAWERWLSKCANGCRGVKEDVRDPFQSKLRRIARSISIAESERAIDALKRSVYWEDKAYAGLVDYIERYWLSIKKVRNKMLEGRTKEHRRKGDCFLDSVLII